MPGVGFSGPEVVWREYFGKNEIVRVKRVLVADFPRKPIAKYIVDFESTNKYDRYGVDIYAYQNKISVRASDSAILDPNFGFSNEVYELLEDCIVVKQN